ncbi:MAG: diguanylate cyclase [Trueperaceae bacterium]
MSDVSTGHMEPAAGGAAEKARVAWESRASAPQRAIDLAREALHERPGGAVSALALASLAVASAHLNEPEEARAAADQVPQLLAEGGPTELADLSVVLIETHLARLRAAFLLDDLGEGIMAGQSALELATAHGHVALEARSHTELGALFGSRELISTALKHMRAGVAILESNDLPQSPILLNNMGNVYLETDRAHEALGFYTRARERFVADGDRFRASLARSNEGRALLKLGRTEEAVAALEQGVEWQQGLVNRSYYATALSKAAIGHAAAGNRAQATTRFEEALAAVAAHEHGDPFEDEIRAEYGDFLMAEGRPSEALAQYERALEHARAAGRATSEASMLERTARALSALGRYEDAYKVLREHMAASKGAEEERNDLALRTQLLELESTISQTNELSVVARQAMIDANRELRERTRYLEDLSVTDDLTGLFNRRYFRLRVVEEEARATRQDADLMLMLIDIDHFKAINDSHSHTVGDAVLKEFGALLTKAFRETDVVARWGGEEFAVLLPGFCRESAAAVAERARKMVEDHDWTASGPDLSLTVSIGIAGLAEVVPLASKQGAGRYEALFELADARLYEAKRQGRNRVVT